MRAGQSGRVVIQWKQTELDGLEAAPLSFLNIGAAWSWRGQAMILVGPVEQTGSQTAVMPNQFLSIDDLDCSEAGVVVLTNGAQEFTGVLYSVLDEPTPVLVFDNGCPARDQDYWVSELVQLRQYSGEAVSGDDRVVAFPGRLQANADHRELAPLPAVNVGAALD
ncbi:hypothetical protein [Ruegeria sp. HKCCA5426]|uniref:hypothetical protein n=1 Tax=Ruegeria sp. HKCCA5426 TaxID=2682985 RepID=UPI001488F742|nr:hypothetical protein [Ruegeria sp. HKCCA5426]